MKKYLMTALVLVASASLFTASAAKKKNVKKVTPVVLATESDSLSYAAGVHATRGLIPFIQQSYKVDTAYMADFIRGYEEAIAKANTPQGTAYIVGMQIAQMVNQRILPGTREELKSAKDSIDAAMFSRGFVAALANDTTLFSVKKAGEFKTQILAGAGEKFLAANAKKPGVKVLPSGLQYKVIKGWTEALVHMPAGSVWEVYIPQQLAYGEREQGQIKPFSVLIFKIELISVGGK